MLGAWLVSLALLAGASADSYTLHHRYLPSGEFTPRGVVSLDPSGPTFTPEASAHLLGEGEWYQVALEVGGDMITTTTRSCFVDEDAKLTLHVSANGRPTSIEFKPAQVPNDGACPSGGARSAKSAVYVNVETPQKVYSPGLAAPPEVDTSTGKVKEPEPEKTFMQKYGLMIAGAAFVLMLQVNAPPEPQRVEGGGGPAQ